MVWARQNGVIPEMTTWTSELKAGAAFPCQPSGPLANAAADPLQALLPLQWQMLTSNQTGSHWSQCRWLEGSWEGVNNLHRGWPLKSTSSKLFQSILSTELGEWSYFWPHFIHKNRLILLLWLSQGYLVSNGTSFEHRSSVYLDATEWTHLAAKRWAWVSVVLTSCPHGSGLPELGAVQSHSAQLSHSAMPLDRSTNLAGLRN